MRAGQAAVVDRQYPKVPIQHSDAAEHRRQIAGRVNAAVAPSLTDLAAGDLLSWTGEAWANQGAVQEWTPTLVATGTDFDSVKYGSGNIGRYIKLGNIVIAFGRIHTTAVTKGPASGAVRVGGLPIAPLSVAGLAFPAAISADGGWENPSFPVRGYAVPGVAQVQLRKRGATGSGSAHEDTDIDVGDVSTTTNDAAFQVIYLADPTA